MSIYDDMSPRERQVADFLKKQLDIYWIYQQPVYVADEGNRPRIFCPDFYLPELGLYIEVCGDERFDYSRRKKIYDDNRIPVVFLEHYKGMEKWSNYVIIKIKEIHEKRSEIIKRLD